MSNLWEQVAWSALDAPKAVVEQAPLAIQVAWLEDAYLRCWEPAARAPLKHGDESAVRAYLRDAVQCPYDFVTEPEKVRQFMLSKAVDCAFADETAEEGNKASAATVKAPLLAELLTLSDELILGSNDVAQVATNWTEYAALEELQQVLGLPRGSPRELLRAASHWAETSWPPREQWLRHYADDSTTGKAATDEIRSYVSLPSSPMQVEENKMSASPLLHQVRAIARQLHVQELLVLQRQMNASIERAQEFTANPRTEARLGKVGR
jgi:hypothetical protein